MYIRRKSKPPGGERGRSGVGSSVGSGAAEPDADFSEILPGPGSGSQHRLSRRRGDSPGPELRGKCLKVFILDSPAVNV